MPDYDFLSRSLRANEFSGQPGSVAPDLVPAVPDALAMRTFHDTVPLPILPSSETSAPQEAGDPDVQRRIFAALSGTAHPDDVPQHLSVPVDRPEQVVDEVSIGLREDISRAETTLRDNVAPNVPAAKKQIRELLDEAEDSGAGSTAVAARVRRILEAVPAASEGLANAHAYLTTATDTEAAPEEVIGAVSTGLYNLAGVYGTEKRGLEEAYDDTLGATKNLHTVLAEVRDDAQSARTSIDRHAALYGAVEGTGAGAEYARERSATVHDFQDIAARGTAAIGEVVDAMHERAALKGMPDESATQDDFAGFMGQLHNIGYDPLALGYARDLYAKVLARAKEIYRTTSALGAEDTWLQARLTSVSGLIEQLETTPYGKVDE
jgi:hypothetical protein